MNHNNHIPKVSVCIIAKNEEDMIEDCLKSVKEISSEIVFVDTGSNDRTKEIASKYTDNIYDFEWIDDFSAARNFAIDKASGDYILSIDADERLLNPEVLVQTLKASDKKYGGWLVNLVSENQRGSGRKDTFRNKLLRLFRNEDGIRFYGSIHEQILEGIEKKAYKVSSSEISFSHLGYDLDPDSMKAKQERNLKLLEKSIKQDPENAYNVFQYAKTLFALKQSKEAEEFFNKAIDIAPKKGAVLPQALNFAAINYFQQKHIKKAIEYAERSLVIVPNQSLANYILGDSYFELREHQKSLTHYNKMLEAQQSNDLKAGIMGDYSLPIDQLYFRIARANLLLNKLDISEKYFGLALDITPKEKSYLIGLSNIKMKKADYKGAKALLMQAKSNNPNDKEIDKYLSEVDQHLENSSPSSVQDLLNIIGVKDDSQKTSQSDKALLSLCMIVKNEEKMLPGCLDSVKDLVDEIILVDTGSEDRTKEIAANYNAKIYDFEWINDFAAARNESLKHANGEWILYLDADERIQNQNKELIRQKLKNSPAQLGAYLCIIESEHTQGDEDSSLHIGAYPRLFKNLGYPTINFSGRVHEQISPAIRDAGLGFEESDVVIRHEGYNISREELEKKLKRNYKLLLDHVNEEPTNGYAWYQLGQTLGQMKLYKESEEAVNFAIKCGNLSDSIFASAANTLAHYSGRKRDFEKALEWSIKSLEKAPEQVYGLNLKAFALLNLGRKKEAEIEFEKALKILKGRQGIPKSGFDIQISEDVILKGLAQARS